MADITDPYGNTKGIDQFHVSAGPYFGRTPEGHLVARLVGWGRDNRPEMILLQGELATFAREHLALGSHIVVRGLFRNDDKPEHVRCWDVHAQEVHLVSSYEASATTRESPPYLREHIVNGSFKAHDKDEMFNALRETAVECTLTEEARRTHPFSQMIKYAERGLTPPQFVGRDIHPDVWSLVGGRVFNVRESEAPKVLDHCRKDFGLSDVSGVVKLRLTDRFAAVERSIDLPAIAAQRLGFTLLERSADGRTAKMKSERSGTTITLERHERGYWSANKRISAVDLVAHALHTSPRHARDLLTNWQREQAVQRTPRAQARRRSNHLER